VARRTPPYVSDVTTSHSNSSLREPRQHDGRPGREHGLDRTAGVDDQAIHAAVGAKARNLASRSGCQSALATTTW